MPSLGPRSQEDRGNSMTIGVADDHIGAVVGRGGRNIMEISQVFAWQKYFSLIHLLDYLIVNEDAFSAG